MHTKYLVTGATGHLGINIIRLLCMGGRDVRALVMDGDENRHRLPPGVEIIIGNVCDKKSLEAFFRNEEADDLVVIHTAGIVSVASKFDRKIYDVNVNGTKNILEMAKKYHVKKLVHISSVHAIPELPHGQVITEVDTFDPECVKGLYAKTKAEATKLVLDAALDGLDASVVHPSGIIGPYDYGKGHLTSLVVDYCTGRLFAAVNGGYDFTDVRDVARGVISCCEAGRRGECYILSNNYVSLKKLFALLHEITKRKPIKFLPMWLAKLSAPMAEQYYKIRKAPPLYTPYSLYTLCSNSSFSHEKADIELGYVTTPIETTLRDTYEWLKRENRI